MNLRQIELFERIMALGSLSEAARSLGLSQPAASRILRHTEDQLGFPLFERLRGRLLPTAEARGLQASAGRLHDALETLENVVCEIKEGCEASQREALVMPQTIRHRAHTMRVRQIEVFHAVMSTGLVTAAAQMLHVSQPAVSKTLREAAHDLGFPLFVTVKGRLIPTPEARRLHRDVCVVFGEVEAWRRQVTDYREGRGDRLRVVATPALGLEILPRAVAVLNQQGKRLPDMSIATAHSVHIIDDVLSGHNDVGFSLNLPEHPGLHRHALAQDHLVCVFPASITPPPPDPITLAEMIRYPLISLERYDPLGIMLHRACAQAGLTLPNRIEVQTYHVALSLVAQGVGVAVLDPYTARFALSTPSQAGAAWAQRVLIRRLEPSLPFTVHAVTSLAARPGHHTERLIDAFRSILLRVRAPAP